MTNEEMTHEETLENFLNRVTHWQEGLPDLHHVKLALKALMLEKQSEKIVGSIHKAHLNPYKAEHWCKEVLLYSPKSPHDSPQHRIILYTK